ncbi:serine hydrolase [Deinococcus cellulosilyticus]|uniref:Serine hydrolase n=1 Tax=Deinococcus cellulosilyticus (strain DSM 18568 / NBRC 106333 / KACC 11606 / 5516J-15) TaxID=1223518 RepID=A0A511NAX4_DEIC1|nr:serine hydrolase [Deinococcus cellulosilyticus]GEM49696.1 serine hydrolase [Deinococcus cellulosilyticus NBRC 106333 = KACC 11606]
MDKVDKNVNALPPVLAELVQRFDGELSLCVSDLQGEMLFCHEARQVFKAASLIKLPILSCALKTVETGALSLQDRLPLAAQDQVPGAGVLHEMETGLALTVKDLLTLMIIVSDNTATNVLIERLGRDTINRHIQQIGLKDTFLVGKLQMPPELQNELQRTGQRSTTSAADMNLWLLKLWQGQLLNPEHTALALGILKKQQDRLVIARRLPRNSDGELMFEVASKSGEIQYHRHDVGIVFAEKPYAVSLLSRGSKDLREHPDHILTLSLAEVSERIFYLMQAL